MKFFRLHVLGFLCTFFALVILAFPLQAEEGVEKKAGAHQENDRPVSINEDSINFSAVDEAPSPKQDKGGQEEGEGSSGERGTPANLSPEERMLRSFSAPIELPEHFGEVWSEVFEAIQRDDLRAVNDGVYELELLGRKTGFHGLDDYSLNLIGQGEKALSVGEFEKAAFYARKALQLSPFSPIVLLKSIPLAQETRTASPAKQVSSFLKYMWRYPGLFFQLLLGFVYPLLWALTFGLYFALFVLLLLRMRRVVIFFSRLAPYAIRGYLGWVLALVVLAFPPFFGPLWCIAVWSFVLLVTRGSGRWLGFAGAVMVILWGAAVPIRENIGVWLRDARVQTMLQASSGIFDEQALTAVNQLTRERPEDGAAFFVLGSLHRQFQHYGAAKDAFIRAESLLGKQPWTLAQKGMLAFQQEDFARAKELFEQAEEQGLSSAEFYYNYSKIVFALLDTVGSMELHRKARDLAPEVVEELQKREALLGKDGDALLAEVRLPVSALFQSALISNPGVVAMSDRVTQSLMPGMRPFFMIFGGFLLLLIFLFSSEKEKRLRFPYHEGYENSSFTKNALRLFPGVSFLCAGMFLRAWLLISFFILLVFPLIHWPKEFELLLRLFPDWYFYHACFAILAVVIVVSLGYSLQEKKSVCNPE